jgi:GntR family transcriptional regulator
MTHHPPSLFSIATGSTEPIYRQLMDQVRRLVASGYLQEDDVLPSVRDIAQKLAVNPMTVSKAYNTLELEGLVQRKRGVGMLVLGNHKTANDLNARLDLVRPTLIRAVQEARQLELEPETMLALFETLLQEKP